MWPEEQSIWRARLEPLGSDRQTVKPPPDPTGELGFEISMQVVVPEMNQIRALGANRGGDTKRFGNAQARRMLRTKERVDDEHARAAEAFDGRWRDALGGWKSVV